MKTSSTPPPRAARPTGLSLSAVAGLLLAGLVTTSAAGCGPPSFIPGTKIPDTPEHREVVGVLERYRLAMERKDVPALVALAHRDYFENGGNNKPDDDYGYEGLIGVLKERMARVKAVRYGIEYRRMTIKGPRALVEVFLDGSFQIRTPDGQDRWSPKKDYHRFVLQREANRWQMLSGM